MNPRSSPLKATRTITRWTNMRNDRSPSRTRVIGGYLWGKVVGHILRDTVSISAHIVVNHVGDVYRYVSTQAFAEILPTTSVKSPKDVFVSQSEFWQRKATLPKALLIALSIVSGKF